MVLSGLLLGALLGYLLQRSRFCVTGAFRDLAMTRSTRYFTPFMVAVAIQGVGVAALTGAGLLTPQAETFAPLAVVVGGLLFGIGIVMAGGCATGTYYRAGEGLIGSWAALGTYALTAAIMKFGPLGGVTKELRAQTIGDATVQDSLGVSIWVPVTVLVMAVGALVVRDVRRERAARAARPTVGVRLPARRSGLGHWLADVPWSPWVGGIGLGVLAILAWVLSTASGRNGGLGITTPSAKIVAFLVTGEASMIDWGVMLVLGILVGAHAAARLSGEFRWRVPDAATMVRSAAGGVVMGVGASLAGGCTIGNALVETSLFSYQGWASLVTMILGTWIGARVFLTRPRRTGATPAPMAVPSAETGAEVPASRPVELTPVG